MNNYDDIINLSRPNTSHTKLGIDSRASQFSPYAALVGYDEKIIEASRLVDKKVEITDEEIEKLNNNLNIINEHIKDSPNITITYFVKDNKKEGGKYVTKEGNVKRIDAVNKTIVFNDNIKINMKDILSMKGDII